MRLSACAPMVLAAVFMSAALKAGTVGFTPMTFEESLQGVSGRCPEWILENQVLMDVAFWGFDGELHTGQLVVDARVVADLQLVFAQMLLLGFPLESVEPICRYGWSDGASMAANNTSGFNYRTVSGTDRLSRHAFGLAIDINPLFNPCCNGDRVSPEGATYDPSAPGTLYGGHPVVNLFKSLGWRWGGDWTDRDYQHFDRQLEERAVAVGEHREYWPPWRLR